MFSPHFEVTDRPDGVVVRAQTRLPLSGLIVGIIASIVCAGIGVALATVPTKAPLAVRLFAFVPLTIGLAGIWCALIVPLFRAGPEPVLIEFDRRTGTVRLPRAELVLRIDQVKRIERVEFEAVHGENRRGIKHIHNVLKYTDHDGLTRFVPLFQMEFHRTCERIAQTLNVPLVAVNVGAVKL